MGAALCPMRDSTGQGPQAAGALHLLRGLAAGSRDRQGSGSGAAETDWVPQVGMGQNTTIRGPQVLVFGSIYHCQVIKGWSFFWGGAPLLWCF